MTQQPIPQPLNQPAPPIPAPICPHTTKALAARAQLARQVI